MAKLTRNRGNVAGEFKTLAAFIAYAGNPSVGDIFTITDTGAKFKSTGNVITASQTPAQTGNATCSDANGNEYELIFDTLHVSKLGAPTGASDTLVFQSAINASANNATILTGPKDYQVTLDALNYGSKTIKWSTSGSTFNTTSKITDGVFLDGVNGSVENFNYDVPTGEQFDVHRVFGSTNGLGKLFVYHFDIKAGASTTGTEPVRGLIGNIVNSGNGEVKAIRVRVEDDGTNGATALMGINASVVPAANTTGCFVASLQEQNPAAIADVATAVNISSTFGNRWANGIIFQQGDEVNDSWIQASLSVAGSPNGRFVKFKDGAGAVIAECDNLGRFRSADSIHAGAYTNGVSIDADSVNRTAAAGNLLVQAGTNSGTILQLAGGGSTQVSISDNGVAFGAATGGRQGSGTINAQAVYDDGVLLCMPVEEALGLTVDEDEWNRLSQGNTRLIDRHKSNKHNGYDGSLESYVQLLELNKAVPGLITKQEIASQFDKDGNGIKFVKKPDGTIIPFEETYGTREKIEIRGNYETVTKRKIKEEIKNKKGKVVDYSYEYYEEDIEIRGEYEIKETITNNPNDEVLYNNIGDGELISKRISMTDKIESMYLAIDYLGVALLDATKRIKELESKLKKSQS